MAVAVLGLAHQLPPGRPRTISSVVATAALVSAGAVLVDQLVELPDVVYGIAMASANLMILGGLVVAGLSLRRRLDASLPLVLGLVTLPAVLAGGLAAIALGERVLEVPLVLLGALWVALGTLLLRGRYSTK